MKENGFDKMKSAFKNRAALLIYDAIILLLCISGVYSLVSKPFLPFNVSSENSFLIISEIHQNSSSLSVGDTILTVDGYKFKNWEEAELYTDAKNIGSKVTVEYLKNRQPSFAKAALINYYSTFEIIVISFVALIFIFLALLVVLKSDDKSAVIFHWAGMGLAMIITLTSGNYSALPHSLSLLNHFLYLFAFTLTPVLFIHFTCVFTSSASNVMKKIIIAFYLFAVLLAAYLFLQYYNAMQNNSVNGVQQYVKVYTYLFRPFLLISVLTAIVIFYRAYKRAADLTTKRKLNWLLLGFLIGPTGFILLWVIPLIVLGHSLLTEAVMHILLIAVPLTVTIAIIKYRLLDINLLLKRSVVYTIVISGLVIIYVLVFIGITFLIKGIEFTVPAIISAVIIALFMNPVKNKVQKFVNRKFFRVEYDFREEQKKYLKDISESHNIYTMAEKVVEHTDKLIPVEKIGFFILDESNKIKLIAHKNFEMLANRSIKFHQEELKSNLSLPVAVDDRVEPGLQVEPADQRVFKRWGMVLVFPVKSDNGNVVAFLVLGKKKSELVFNKDDIDLLNTVTTAISITMDRIKLQQDLIFKQLEAERLEELNKVKSFFVSTVSHELKTPLTSIKMFAEMLKDNPDCSTEKAQEYLQIIEGESERLKRLINNVLDFTKIEKGIKIYDKKKIELNSIVSKVLRSMEYQFKMAKISIDTNLNEQSYNIFADKDAVEEAVMNILSNAIKYSKKNTIVTVSTFKKEKYACVKITDNGIGISKSKINKIFEPFYRHESDLIKAEGTGLGLAIVKHIIDAHQGKIEVESKPGKGSSFILLFPMED
ncbi:alkaline phosphatase synthesis sensor protein PhoR [bacterium BMS3Abin03]|nr:alkaline phosphatase synthesis sensor protein PhoR [bacterium BMS3Abin03]